MPLENSIKKAVFYINEDGEYKELGEAKEIQIIQDFGEAAKKAGKAMKDFIDTFEREISIPVEFKRYKRKRFKKLLMARGIQRNEADYYSKTLPRTDFYLIKILNEKGK